MQRATRYLTLHLTKAQRIILTLLSLKHHHRFTRS